MRWVAKSERESGEIERVSRSGNLSGTALVKSMMGLFQRQFVGSAVLGVLSCGGLACDTSRGADPATEALLPPSQEGTATAPSTAPSAATTPAASALPTSSSLLPTPSTSEPPPLLPWPPSPRGIPVVEPGVGIYPVRLGATRADLKKTGLPVGPHPSGAFDDDVLVVGGYHVVLRNERVSSIEATLTMTQKGLFAHGKVIPTWATLERAASVFEGCGPFVAALGGEHFSCEGDTVLVKRGGGQRLIHVQVFDAPIPPLPAD